MRILPLGVLSLLALVGCGGSGGGGGATPPPPTSVPEPLRGIRHARFVEGNRRGTVQINVLANGDFSGFTSLVTLSGNATAPTVVDSAIAGRLSRQSDGSFRVSGSTTGATVVPYTLTLAPAASGPPTIGLSVTTGGTPLNVTRPSVAANALIPDAIVGQAAGNLADVFSSDPVPVSIRITRLGDFGGTIAFPFDGGNDPNSFYGTFDPVATEGSFPYVGFTQPSEGDPFNAAGFFNPSSFLFSYRDPDAPEFVYEGNLTVVR